MKTKILFLIFLIFISCKDKLSTNSFSTDSKLDAFFVKAYDLSETNFVRATYNDSIYEILKTKPNDFKNRKDYLKLAIRYNDIGDSTKYIKTLRFLLKNSELNKDTIIAIKSLKYIGNYHFNLFRNDSAYFYYTKAEKINKKIKNKIDFKDVELSKANILYYEKDFAGCEIAIINILIKAIKEKNNRLIYDCYITLGNVLDGLNDFEKSLEYYNKAFDISDKLKNDSQYFSLKAQTYIYIGCLYNKKKKYKQAKSYFEKGLIFSESKKLEQYLYANIMNNLGYSEFKLGQNSALNKLNEAYNILDSIKNIPGIVSSKINLSEYYLFQRDTAKAFMLSKEAKNLAHSNNIFEDELKTLELLAKIDPKNNEVYSNRFIKLTDSLQNNERATRNKFARIEFETDEILNQKKTIEVEKNAISSQRWLILGFSLLVLVIGALIYFTKMQHSKNKVLEYEKEQQKANEAIYQLMLDQQTKIDEGRNVEKKRISQELHDGIMSKLTATRLNLFVLSKKNDEETIKKCLEYINKIQDIEQEIRAISHDLSNDIFINNDSFKMIIEELFENQSKISNFDYSILIDENINWDAIASTTKMNLYRIFQECLQNIYKYAKAKNVDLKIILNQDNIEVEITDNGKGFDVSKTKDGIGLKNMKSRSDFINGQLNIVSNINKGTVLVLIFPI